MLDAFIKKGVRRIFLARATEHLNNKNEDAITSMIFTPLRFMSPPDALECFSAILPKLQQRVEARQAKALKLELWPSVPMKNNWVQPELKANIKFTDGTSLTLIGEMKWESFLSSEQIQKYERIKWDAFVFAIVKNPGFVDAGLKCEVYTWKQVHGRVENLIRDTRVSEQVRQWAELAANFLKIAEQLVFSGFNSFKPIIFDHPTFFFSQVRQFRRFDWPSSAIQARSATSTMFYDRRPA